MPDPAQTSQKNSGAEQPKRQHYVPRGYLRPFLDSGGKIRVFDLETGREFRTARENAAVETYFYDLEVKGKRLSAERFLSALEGAALPVVRQLLADPGVITSLGEEEEFALARFVASLRFRTPAFRAWEQDLASSLEAEAKGFVKAQVCQWPRRIAQRRSPKLPACGHENCPRAASAVASPPFLGWLRPA